jgi:hypothetical protein
MIMMCNIGLTKFADELHEELRKKLNPDASASASTSADIKEAEINNKDEDVIMIESDPLLKVLDNILNSELPKSMRMKKEIKKEVYSACIFT